MSPLRLAACVFAVYALVGVMIAASSSASSAPELHPPGPATAYALAETPLPPAPSSRLWLHGDDYEPDAALGVGLGARAFELPGTRLDDAAFLAGGDLVAATRVTPKDELLEPTLLRVERVDPAERPTLVWEAAALGASPIGLAASGDRGIAAWTQRAYPGRDLAFATFGGDGPARVTIVPWPFGAAEGAVAPRALALDEGVLVCAGTVDRAPACALVDAAGEATLGPELKALSGARPLTLLPAPGGGAWLFAEVCADAATCRRGRLVLQTLDANGAPHGAHRRLGNFELGRGLAAVTVDGGALLFGKRPGAKKGAAWLIEPRRMKELEGKWGRAVGGMRTAEGAVVVEMASLRMLDGRPVASLRARRWTRSDGRLPREAWPEGVKEAIPTATDLDVRPIPGGTLAWDTSGLGVIRGVALRHVAGPETTEAAAPDPQTARAER
ncbi:MAG: hypothetical protein H6745_03815 [Deltaproteobacteria bacterium]|nr:hypothetical protein [Deltaproteobacteria bacterium]